MNLNQLKIFYMAVKSGDLTRAANHLCISQPAVSKAIQRFQNHYDVKLVEKRGKRLFPNEAGTHLYQVAEDIFRLEKEAEHIINQFRADHQKSLTIHTSETFADYYLSPALNLFVKSFPKVKVRVDIMHNADVLENTINSENDIGIVSEISKNAHVQVIDSFSDELVLIVPPDHRIADKEQIGPKDLENEFIIMHEKGSVPHKIVSEYIETNRINLKPGPELSSNRAIKQAVLDKIGISIISKLSAKEEVKLKTLCAIPFADGGLKRAFQIIKPPGALITKPMKRLVSILDEIRLKET